MQSNRKDGKRSRHRRRRSPSTEERRLYARLERRRSHDRDSMNNSPVHREEDAEAVQNRRVSHSQEALHDDKQQRNGSSRERRRGNSPHDVRACPLADDGTGDKGDVHSHRQGGQLAAQPLPPSPSPSPWRHLQQQSQTSSSVAVSSTVPPAVFTSADYRNAPVLAASHAELTEGPRRATRSYLPSTLTTDDMRTPVVSKWESGVLGSGVPPSRSVLPLPPVLPQRPATPALVPAPGVWSFSPSPHFALLSSKVVPFSYDEYVEWLYTPSIKRQEEGEAVERRTKSIPRRETAAHTQHLYHCESDEAVNAETTGVNPSSTFSKLTTPASATSPAEEIRYDREFSVSTQLAAVLAAPPLAPSTSTMPSLLANRSMRQQSRGLVAGDDSVRHSQGDHRIPCLQRTNTSGHLVDSCGDADSPSPNARSAHSSQLHDNDAEEGIRAFVKNFEHGKVHTRPPWFLCSTLLTNCEHPYYTSWLDEIDVGTVEEELARARAAQGGVLGAPPALQPL
jgi:hypothetical protein